MHASRRRRRRDQRTTPTCRASPGARCAVGQLTMAELRRIDLGARSERSAPWPRRSTPSRRPASTSTSRTRAPPPRPSTAIRAARADRPRADHELLDEAAPGARPTRFPGVATSAVRRPSSSRSSPARSSASRPLAPPLARAASTPCRSPSAAAALRSSRGATVRAHPRGRRRGARLDGQRSGRHGPPARPGRRRHRHRPLRRPATGGRLRRRSATSDSERPLGETRRTERESPA